MDAELGHLNTRRLDALAYKVIAPFTAAMPFDHPVTTGKNDSSGQAEIGQEQSPGSHCCLPNLDFGKRELSTQSLF
ncbi:hypothetical protein [Pseudomonas mandelii]|uniref:hypothetical protein n=1 Tax=Pseudomonas mandelii TaxID=75612 RepID=UPI00209F8D36|nr:hypothetical protein [Pseudomonas mandelii]MCO8312459.1 hypothetical protein [Pseudomonas mandelii]